jgi:nucleoside diphosphate kinase
MIDVDWDRTVFVLIAPDALARRVGETVLHRMAADGFRPIGWRVLWHRPTDLDAFNERNITQVWHGYLYRLVDQLFALGPTVAVLVHDDTPVDGLTSHQRLRRLKGASEPAEAAADSIRGSLGSINVMLALMHTADTAADARHESDVFTAEGGYLDGDRAELYHLVRLLQAAQPCEVRGHAEVIAGIRARLLAAVWDDLSPGSRRAALDRGDAEQLGQLGAGKPLADLLPASHPLADVLRADFTPDDRGPVLDRVRRLLPAYGLALDPWEDLVLVTSRRFTPRRRAW